ncbi:unnamed protein product (macronuclear) [Paramecium tetraurelia]|uniref:Acyl-coenzyme A oxidase n=1 Tax=Paramecium tetraurelia TaxID=5888 RepID=A0E489_PARTE|nr:uncharacterized protein GSPATT00023280001 [Paramecium tetraurelia]CAK90106.1 unnamed protein product [Paramecium tetraurelia]|eukprot:XP_001457503.1 hypothetical protein (macronuclear) [Paramecium tetraurelia strain d4-2]
MLEKERKQAQFPQLEMSHLLYGDKEGFDKFIERQTFFDNHPLFKVDFNFFNKSRQDQILLNAQKTIEAVKNLDLANQKYYTPNILCPQGNFISTVHFAMVIPAFQVLASDDQIERWMPSLKNFYAFGCYAQSELGHGSDVQSILTVATFDKTTSEFIIHTPNVEATKFWPGELGLYCEFALVFAQLIVDGKNHGVHPFWIRIRDKDTHRPMQGVQIGDIGPKMGFAVKDNGYMSFDHFRAPLDSLLNRYIKVSSDGKVERQGNPKVGYASMLYMRNILCDQYTKFAGKALTVAVRYSLYRRQFKDDNKQEILILDYQCQQQKLFPLLAEFYACVFGSIKIKELTNENFNKITQQNDFSMLNLTHSILSAAKSNYTYFVANCAEWCRLSCGGHGFAHYSGLPTIFFEMSPNIVLEGENTILNLQLARYLLKQLQNTVSKPDSVPSYFQFLSTDTVKIQDVTTIQSLATLLGCNCSILTRYAASKFMAHSDLQDSWDTKSGIALAKAASAFIPYFNMICFIDTIQYKAKDTKEILTVLAQVYGITMLLNNFQGLLLKNQISSEQIKLLQDTREQLYPIIRRNALSLVEAQGLSDNTLQSLIAPKDGDVYENMYRYASQDNSLNKQKVHEGVTYIKKMKEVNAKL